jgi:hypothetical protein
MMELSSETLELLRVAIYSGTIVFVSMLLVHAVSELVQRLFGGED